MSIEKSVLAILFEDRKAYDRINQYVEELDFTGKLKVVYDNLSDYYNQDPLAVSVDKDVLKQTLIRLYPKWEEDWNLIIDSLPKSTTSNATKEFLALKRSRIGERLIAALASNREEEAEILMEKYRQYDDEGVIEQERGQRIYTNINIRELTDAQRRADFRLIPSILNEKTDGGAYRGHHILVYARPDVGKTLFIINLISGFLRDGHKVLYVGNEDPPNKIIFRLLCRLTARSKQEVLSDVDQATEEAQKVGWNNFIFSEMVPGSIQEIEKLMERYKPDVVVVDQVRNLKSKSDGMTDKLEEVAIKIRNLGKYYNALMVSVTQAGFSAANKLTLDMEDIDSSKTGIQAAVDLMIGIGMDAECDATDRRMISLRKNKLGGRNTNFLVSINKLTNQIKTIG